jgi:hypothetical protein
MFRRFLRRLFGLYDLDEPVWTVETPLGTARHLTPQFAGWIAGLLKNSGVLVVVREDR